MKQAGADRYLMRHETASPELYASYIHTIVLRTERHICWNSKDWDMKRCKLYGGPTRSDTA